MCIVNYTSDFKLRTFKRIFSCCVHRSELRSHPSRPTARETKAAFEGALNGKALSRLAALTVCGARIETQRQDFKLRIQGCPVFERLLSNATFVSRAVKITTLASSVADCLQQFWLFFLHFYSVKKKDTTQNPFIFFYLFFLQRSKSSSVKKRFVERNTSVHNDEAADILFNFKFLHWIVLFFKHTISWNLVGELTL